MLTKIFGYLIVFILLSIPVLIYRRWYPFRLFAVRVQLDGLCVVTYCFRPCRSFYRSFSCGLPYSFVSLGNGYVALTVPGSSDQSMFYGSAAVSFSSDVIIFQRSRLGRLRSVDLSDRCLVDILSKFKSEV